MAEYKVCILRLEGASELKIKILDIYGDSMLIICQVKGECQTKIKKLRPYQLYMSKLEKEFDEIKFTHMGKDKNQFADALTTLAFMAKIVKRSVIAYRLADNVIEDYELLNFDFLNKDVLVVEKEEELD